MNEIQELLDRINFEHQYLENLHVNKQYIFAYLDNKRNHLNSFVEGYKDTFVTVEDAASRIQQLNCIKRKLSSLQAVPMQNMHLEIERLKSEATPLYCKVKIDIEAPDTSAEDMKHMFRVVDHGHIWEDKDEIIHNLRQKLNECSNTLNDMITEHGYILQDKDTTIHNLRQKWNECSNTLRDTITDLIDHADKLKEKDSIIHSMKHEMEEMKQRLENCSQSGYLMNPGFQPPDSNVAVPQLYPIYTTSIQPEECQDFEPSSVCDNCTEPGTTQLQHDIARLQEELNQSKQMIVKLEIEAQTHQRDVDRLEQNLQSLSEELEQTKADQESKQIKVELENEAQTRQRDVDRLEQNIQSLSEELEQTKADQERNYGRTVSNFYGATNVMNGSSKDMALQFGNENRMRNLAENVQHNPWEREN